MRATYRVLAHIVAGLVMFQAAVMVFAVSGLYIWIQDGNSLTEAVMNSDSPPEFTGSMGFMLHFFGALAVVLTSLILMIVSFFAKIPGGVKWGSAVFGLALLQFALGIFGHESPYSGLLHGLNALVLFTTALLAGRRVSMTAEETHAPEVAVHR